VGAIDLSQTYADVLDASGWPDALPRPGNQRLKRLPSAAPWFEVYEAAPATFAILEPHHYEEVISYLILGDDRAVLLDTGMGIGDIRAEVQRLTGRPIIVVNSHSHYDHVGGNHWFRDVWAFDDGLEIDRIEAGIAPVSAAQFVPPDSYREAPPGFDPSTYRIRPSSVTRRLRDLDEMELGSRALTVHHTPGHSPGSICLHDNRTGILFTGDTLYPGTLYAHFAESDFAAYRRSLGRLAALLGKVSHLCPAHNEAHASTNLVCSAREAFESIAAGEAAFHTHGDARIYTFEGFRVTTARSE
jgi:glyoxylase-like metal-dependent hydrolase (beta-lactamase superfamily II)